jgi:phosphoglycerate dehydrogenase-like enzyme
MVLKVTIAADGMLERETTPPMRHALSFPRYDDPEALAASLRDADALVSRRVNVTPTLLAGAPRLKLVQQVGIGTDRIDLAEAGARGVSVANTPEAVSNTVVEHTFMIMLAALRDLEGQMRGMRGDGWSGGEVWSGEEFAGKTVGIIGYGSIGADIARRSAVFGARVIVNTRTPRETTHDGIRFVDLPTVLAESDILVVAAGLNASTRGMLGWRELELLKPSVLFVNIARGAIVDEVALVEMLASGRIKFAALDAFAREPLPVDSPLRSLPNVVLTPHSAGSSRQSSERIWRQMKNNLDRLADGRALVNIVNLDRLKPSAALV